MEEIAQLKSKNKEVEQFLSDLQLEARSLAGENNEIQGRTAEMHRNELALKSEIEKLLEMVRKLENEK